LPESGNSGAPETEKRSDAGQNLGTGRQSDEASTDQNRKRKRRVSEEPSTSSSKPATGSLPASLSVTPTSTATVVKHRNQDDRTKIAEMYVTLKRTTHLLVQLCEGGLKSEEPSSSSRPAKNDTEPAKSGKRESSGSGESRPEVEPEEKKDKEEKNLN